MRLKHLSKTFLKVGKIINIVLIPLFAVLLIVLSIVDGVRLAQAVAEEATEEVIAARAAALGATISTYIILLILAIAAIILLKIGKGKVEAAKAKRDAIPGAVLLIVSGALLTVFPIASGILLLCTKESDWGEKAEEPALEEKPAEGVKEEPVNKDK